jgi:hypothetical protein
VSFPRNTSRFPHVSRKGLKGAEWGSALATYAAEYPNKASGGERPLWRQIGVAVRGRTTSYDFQTAHVTFDRATFKSTGPTAAAMQTAWQAPASLHPVS